MLLKHEAQQEKWQTEYKVQQAEYEAQKKKEQAEYEAQQKKEQAEYKARHEKWLTEYEAQQAALNKQIAEMSARVDMTTKNVDQVSKNVDGISKSLGRLIEDMVSTEVWRKFTPLGYEFTQAAQRKQFVENNECIAEVDFFLENGEYVMAIEVKTKFEIEYVKMHIERIETVRKYMDAKKDGRKIVGAIAGGVMPEGIIKYAQRKGLYVLTQSGETFTLAKTGAKFKAKEW
ncbi:MAG: hypothetical protein LBG72_07945 [Spirochaetaceae bacterium]|nr:hypothetical protein [Spirochaetaceae bacterium]